MEQHLLEIKTKLYEMDKKLDEMQLIQVKQQVILDEHIARTSLLEEAVEKMDNRLRPIENHVFGINTIGKFLGVISVIVGILVSLAKLFKFV